MSRAVVVRRPSSARKGASMRKARIALLVTLLTLLTLGPIYAKPWSMAKPEAPSLVPLVWEAVFARVAALFEKGGGELDPDGCEGTAATTPTPLPGGSETDGRGELDPNGAP